MAITAKDVKELREKTGVGMMECKKALTEADGDMEKAIDILRERGAATAAKKASRVAADGAVVTYFDDKAKKGVIVEVNSETDFVAKNEKFMAFCNSVAKTIIANDTADVETLLTQKLVDEDITVADKVTALIQEIKENIKVRRFEKIDGNMISYIHAGGAVGVAVKFDTDDATAEKPEFVAMGKNVAMQIAAMSPSYLDAESVPAEVIEHEKGILKAQMDADPKFAGKPDAVKEKIAGGKISKFYKENCLVDQEFVRGDIFKGDVKGYVASVAKELGADIKIACFVRFAKGEGIEKKEENFAAEIAGMVNG